MWSFDEFIDDGPSRSSVTEIEPSTQTSSERIGESELREGIPRESCITRRPTAYQIVLVVSTSEE
jgi:hypothetical protein